MKFLRSAAAEVIALFVDDGALAIAVLVLIGGIAAAVKAAALAPLAGGVLLLVGCVVILVESVYRVARTTT